MIKSTFWRAFALTATLILTGCSHSQPEQEGRPQAWLQPASQVLADVMLSHWPISAWETQLPTGWTLRDNGDKRELRNASGKLVTEITYLNRQGKRVPISIEQHVFKYHITIQYLGD